jgi:hypothetical protein
MPSSVFPADSLMPFSGMKGDRLFSFCFFVEKEVNPPANRVEKRLSGKLERRRL